MPQSARSVQRTYLTLMLGNTLAASLIWGINTIFLLDAGLTDLEAFAVNAFFTAGMLLFEIPTGVVADTVGRRASYLLGTVTLMASTLLYVLLWQLAAPFWSWALVSMLLGLGFTFFSGAVVPGGVERVDEPGLDRTREEGEAQTEQNRHHRPQPERAGKLPEQVVEVGCHGQGHGAEQE